MSTIRKFFKSYSTLSQGTDAAAIANLYGEHIIAAGPKGTMSFKNDSEFIKWIQAVIDFNATSGMLSMDPVKVSSEAIGEAFSKARVTWRAVFEKKKNEPVEFNIDYILFHPEDDPKIIMYISHEDQEELMKEKGL